MCSKILFVLLITPSQSSLLFLTWALKHYFSRLSSPLIPHSFIGYLPLSMALNTIVYVSQQLPNLYLNSDLSFESRLTKPPAYSISNPLTSSTSPNSWRGYIDWFSSLFSISTASSKLSHLNYDCSLLSPCCHSWSFLSPHSRSESRAILKYK